jgi:shikimate 5-dehydrogenase
MCVHRAVEVFKLVTGFTSDIERMQVALAPVVALLGSPMTTTD